MDLSSPNKSSSNIAGDGGVLSSSVYFDCICLAAWFFSNRTLNMAFSIERHFDHAAARQWMSSIWIYTIPISFVYYFGLVRFGQWFMKNRRPVELRNALVLWNAALAVFSIAGTARVWPEFVEKFGKDGFHASFCKVGNYYEGANGFWHFLFSFSKLIELGDTVFLVLRKRPVIFLHWYHHIIVLIFSFYSYQFDVPQGRWGCTMNYMVHSFMYTYYMLRAANFKVPQFVSISITALQILQMLIGTYVCFTVFGHVVLGLGGGMKSCDCEWSVAVMQAVMFSSLLVLFCNFFYSTYIKKRSKKTA